MYCCQSYLRVPWFWWFWEGKFMALVYLGWTVAIKQGTTWTSVSHNMWYLWVSGVQGLVVCWQGGEYNSCKSTAPGLDVRLLATVLAGDVMFFRTGLYPGEHFWRKINMQGLLCLSLPSGVSSLLPVALHAWQGSFACGPAGDCQCISDIVRFLAAYFVSQLYRLSVHFEKCSVDSVKRLQIPADEAWPCLLK